MGRHVLVVGSGAGGGIGRFERLLTSALGVLSRSGRLTFSVVCASQPPDYLGRDSSTAGRGVPVMLPRGASRVAFVGLVGRQLRAQRPDLTLFTHVNHLSALPVLVPLGALPFGVCTYGIEVWERREWIVRTNLSFAQEVLAISDYTKKRLAVAQSLPLSRITVVPLALEPGWIEGLGPAKPHARRQETRFLTVSRLDPRERYKGIDAAIRAVARCRSAGLPVHHDIVGEGGDVSRLRAVAAESGVSGAVTFHGRVTDTELRQLYAKSDAFVLPSRGEGFGLVFLEAMAAGLPVVAIRTCATPEVVTHGKTGLLADNEEGLADALKAVAQRIVNPAAMGAAGREEAVGRFSFERFVARVDRFVSGVGR